MTIRRIGKHPHHARALLIVLGLLGAFAAAAAEPLEVRIAWLGPDDSEALLGARQGLDEANAQGRFLGQRYTLVAARDEADAVALDPIAIVTDLSPLRTLRLAESTPEMPVFNLTAEDDELREACQPNLFHTIPSLAMRDDALQQWQRKHPAASVEARAWHEDFRKYAAAQLNQRYTKAHQRPMSDAAWAGWAAVKLLSDTVARLGGADRAVLVEALRNDLAFDGQKGVDMSFRNTGQLRQPLLLVEQGRIVGEAPVRGIVSTDHLDSLGLADCLK